MLMIFPGCYMSSSTSGISEPLYVRFFMTSGIKDAVFPFSTTITAVFLASPLGHN